MEITAALLREWLSEVDWDIDVQKLNGSAPLAEQGLDSLDMITLFFFLEKKLGIKMPDSDVVDLDSLEDIAEYLGSL